MSEYFDTPPVLMNSARLQLGRGKMDVKVYGERSSRDGTVEHVPAELRLCKEFANVLNRHYPGHPWSVEVMVDQSIATIGIPPLLGVNWAYVLHLDKIDVDYKQVVEAGGEILERFHIPRSGIDLAAYVAAIAANPLAGSYRSNHRKVIPQ